MTITGLRGRAVESYGSTIVLATITGMAHLSSEFDISRVDWRVRPYSPSSIVHGMFPGGREQVALNTMEVGSRACRGQMG